MHTNRIYIKQKATIRTVEFDSTVAKIEIKFPGDMAIHTKSITRSIIESNHR